MSVTTTRRRTRFRMIRIDVPGDCVCAPNLQKTIMSLQRHLAAAESRIGALAAQVERLRGIVRNRAAATSSSVAYIERHEGLTSREREVLLQFLEHPSDKEVAAQLGSQLQTVRNQMRSIQTKLSVKSRAEMVAVVFCRRLPKRRASK